MAGGKIRDGKYSIAGQKGLAPGEYAVYITIEDPNWNALKEPSPKEMAPPDYTTGKHKVTVSEGSNVFDFDIKAQ